MGEKDDDVLGLGLSLSLSLGMNNQIQKKPQQLVSINHNRTSSSDLFQFPDRSSDMRTTFVGGIDVNSTAAPDCDDDNGDSSPNSTVSSASGGKRSDRDEDNGAPASILRGSDDDDGGDGGGDVGRKKLRLTKEQAMVLEETFKEHNTLNPKRKQALAEKLNLRPRQVEVWFQNRRARTKLKQTEVDCEYLKRCCENLTEENRRLQKEIQQLRALKLSPHLYMHMKPPTTLTMCPSCERVAVKSGSSSSATAAVAHQNVRRLVPVNHWPFEGSIPQP